jgi:hypothetical protein
VSRMKCSERLSLISTTGLTALAMLMVVPCASAQGTPLNFQLPALLLILGTCVQLLGFALCRAE